MTTIVLVPVIARTALLQELTSASHEYVCWRLSFIGMGHRIVWFADLAIVLEERCGCLLDGC